MYKINYTDEQVNEVVASFNLGEQRAFNRACSESKSKARVKKVRKAEKELRKAEKKLTKLQTQAAELTATVGEVRVYPELHSGQQEHPAAPQVVKPAVETKAGKKNRQHQNNPKGGELNPIDAEMRELLNRPKGEQQ